ncbi:MAG: hypothetical protein H0Z33_10400 [Bacillaceae bacterium]|nr:hypothetical protein [Bacillaceae bacterium]
MGKENKLKYYLDKANLYFLLAKKYEYVDPARHIHYYQKHLYHVQKLEYYYMKYHDSGDWKDSMYSYESNT